MDTKQDVRDRARRLDERLAHYIPPRDVWNPADESLYKPVDLYQVRPDEAPDMQLNARLKPNHLRPLASFPAG
ncbi:MAG: hypothetical protein WCE81_11095 [Halobacteriota archaeon]